MKLRNKPRILRQTSVLDLGTSTSVETPVSPNQMRIANGKIAVLESEMDTAQEDILTNADAIEYLLGAQAADVGCSSRACQRWSPGSGLWPRWRRPSA